MKKADARVWMWEAWWQGNPYLNIEQYYRDTVFGQRTSDEGSYDRAITSVLAAAQPYPYVIVQTTAADAARFERLVAAHRTTVETVAPFPEEVYVIGKN
jgi:hypothetical protein